MNRLLALSLIVCSVLFGQAQATRFLGTVVYPRAVNNISDIKILYKGNEYNVVADGLPGFGQYELIEATGSREFFVLVTESLKVPNSTGVEYLETSDIFPYKLFRLSQTTIVKPDEKGVSVRYNTWNVQELDNSESRRIPLNTVVFLLPASFVTGLEPQPWKKDDQVAWLPRVVLDASLTQERLREGVVKMMCTIMDFKPFHARAQQHISQVASNCVVSMPITRSSTVS